jgi:alkanesulfonate monooxygenase SsuD/methylene tetrahydromethanopterin reductase-like flavin-dependent oxidoreductase (luciferase family)
MRRTARRAEELGYASLWTFQRVLYPADGGLDPSHRTVHDPVVALAHVAGHTDRIRLGTATLCAPLRRHCAAPAGSPRAGSAAAVRTSPRSARASRRRARGRA